MSTEKLGVAEAKRRFSELIERVRRGERLVVYRHGKPAVALVAPEDVSGGRSARPLGLASFAGALDEWEEFADTMQEIVALRTKARDRAVPEFD